MLLILGLLVLERVLRGRKRFSFTTTKVRLLQPVKLQGKRKWLAFGYCMFVFGIAFIIPFIQLIYWAMLTYDQSFSVEFLQVIGNTIGVAFVARRSLRLWLLSSVTSPDSIEVYSQKYFRRLRYWVIRFQGQSLL